MDRLPILDLGPQYRSLKPEILGAVERVLESGAFIMGPDVGAFEHEVADYLGVKHAIGLNSGTDALVLAMRALEIGPGDEVITTSFTFFATAEAISRVGATPIFVDVNESTFTLDPSSVSGAISSRTKAIVPVHLFGRPADMAELIEIANAAGIPIVEDCAQSFGARFLGNEVRGATRSDGIVKREPAAGKQCGTMGVIGAYSFFPSKNLGAYGDGGLVVTDDDSIAEKLRLLHAHGARKKFVNELVGYNSRLDSLQAAVLAGAIRRALA